MYLVLVFFSQIYNISKAVIYTTVFIIYVWINSNIK